MKHLQLGSWANPACGAERQPYEYGTTLSTVTCKDCARIKISKTLKEIADCESRLAISRHDPVPKKTEGLRGVGTAYVNGEKIGTVTDMKIEGEENGEGSETL